MKRIAVLSLCVLLVTGCVGAGSRLDELQKSNEDLKVRVKALEDELLQTDKRVIQQEQLIKQMYERVKDMENAINKMEMGPAPAR